MNDLPMAIAGALFLIAAAFSPKSNRSKLTSFFGLPSNFAQDIFTSGDNHSQTQESLDRGTGSFTDYTNQEPQKTSWPKNRKLTEAETYSLARYIVGFFPDGLIAVNPYYLVKFAYIESSFRPWVERDEGFDVSVGLMQTLVGTAQDMHKKGYNKFPYPTRENLKTPEISMYYGAAYVHWLSKNYNQRALAFDASPLKVGLGSPTLEYLIRSYNGGPGWQSTPNGAKNTAHYYKKFQKAPVTKRV